MGKTTRAQRRVSRGYTIVEVMLSISMLIIASAGIISLQKATAFGNMRAKELAVANQIGRSWIERLRTDSITWNYPSTTYQSTPPDLVSDTLWLKAAPVNGVAGAWLEPAFVPQRGSAAADALGNDLLLPDYPKAAYCTHVRLNWMYPGEVLRADVRVVWLRSGGPGLFPGVPLCGNSGAAAIQNFDTPLATNPPFTRFHFVYFSSSIVKNAAQ
jgi:type II secretory pathway pseudopilin PulG